MRWCCCGCLILALLLFLGLAGVTLFAAMPLPSSVGTLGRPRDLGVRWTPADYQSVYQKTHVEHSAPELHCLTCPTTYSGKQPVGDRFTDCEISAWLSTQNAKHGPLRDVQVRFNADGTGELSGLLVEQVNTPVYAKGRLTRASARAVSFGFEAISVGPVPLPQPIVQRAGEAVSGIVNDELDRIDGLEIQDLRIEAGGLVFKGTLPQAARGSAPGR